MMQRWSHRLEGLEPDNFLAFMALLGLLRALETARPEWCSRAAWDLDRAPWRPILSLRADVSREEVAAAAAEGCKKHGTELRALTITALQLDGESDRKPEKLLGITKSLQTFCTLNKECDVSALRVLSCLAGYDLRPQNRSQLNIDVAKTPLCFPSARMAFAGTMVALLVQPDVKKIESSLFENWTYSDKGLTLRLDPTEATRYALQAKDPSPQGAYSERGASTLASTGLLCLPMICTSHGAEGRSFRRYGRTIKIRWPVWPQSDLMSLSSLAAILDRGNGAGSAADHIWYEAETFFVTESGDYKSVTWGVQVEKEGRLPPGP